MEPVALAQAFVLSARPHILVVFASTCQDFLVPAKTIFPRGSADLPVSSWIDWALDFPQQAKNFLSSRGDTAAQAGQEMPPADPMSPLGYIFSAFPANTFCRARAKILPGVFPETWPVSAICRALTSFYDRPQLGICEALQHMVTTGEYDNTIQIIRGIQLAAWRAYPKKKYTLQFSQGQVQMFLTPALPAEMLIDEFTPHLGLVSSYFRTPSGPEDRDARAHNRAALSFLIPCVVATDKIISTPKHWATYSQAFKLIVLINRVEFFIQDFLVYWTISPPVPVEPTSPPARGRTISWHWNIRNPFRNPRLARIMLALLKKLSPICQEQFRRIFPAYDPKDSEPRLF